MPHTTRVDPALGRYLLADPDPELLDWGAKRRGYVDLPDYALDLLTEEANNIANGARRPRRRP
jgi:hypothetical protein